MSENSYKIDYNGIDSSSRLATSTNEKLNATIESMKADFIRLYEANTFAGPVADDASTNWESLSASLEKANSNFISISNILNGFKENYQDTDKLCEQIVSLAKDNGYTIAIGGKQITVDRSFLFSQSGSKWRNLRTPDNGNTFALAGCSFCSAACALCMVTGSSTYDPKWVAKRIKELGIANINARYSYIGKLADDLGLQHYSVDGKDSEEMNRVFNDLKSGTAAAQVRIKPGGKIGGRTIGGGHYVEACGARETKGYKEVLIYDSAMGGVSYWEKWDNIKKYIRDDKADNDSITIIKQ